jgi:hypothetical protein
VQATPTVPYCEELLLFLYSSCKTNDFLSKIINRL